MCYSDSKQYECQCYTLKLNENKTIKASPVKEGQNASLNPPGNALTADNTVAQSEPVVKPSDRDPEMAKVNMALEKENAKLREDVVSLKELLKLQRQVAGGTKFTKSSVEAAAGVMMKAESAKGGGLQNPPLLCYSDNKQMGEESV